MSQRTSLDMTTGKPIKLLQQFIVPLILGNIVQELYNVGDMAVVGRVLGKDLIASVGVTGCLYSVFFALISGFTHGLTILSGQRFGAKDFDGMHRSMTQALALSLSLAVIITIISTSCSRQLLKLMNTPQELIDQADTYLNTLFWGLPAMVFYYILACFLRALGNSRTPLHCLIICCALNIGGDILFTIVFDWGIAGIAWATNIAQTISGLLCLLYLLIYVPEFRPASLRCLKDVADIRAHLKLGFAMCVHTTIISAGSVFMQYGLNHYKDSIAGFTIASKINSITFLPLLSFGTAIVSYVSQNFGAKRYMRIRVGIRCCIAFSVVCSLITATLFLTCGRLLVRLFTGEYDENLESSALTYLYIGIPFYLILGLMIVHRGSLQGMGNTTGPIYSSFFELATRISGVLLLPLLWGYFGICLTNPLAWVGGTIPVAFVYWKIMKKIPKRNLGFGGYRKWIDI